MRSHHFRYPRTTSLLITIVALACSATATLASASASASTTRAVGSSGLERHGELVEEYESSSRRRLRRRDSLLRNIPTSRGRRLAMDEEDNDTGEEEVARAREAAGGGGGPSSSSCEYTDLAHSIDDVVDDGSVVMRYSLHPSTTRNSNDGLLCVRLEVDMDDIDIDVTNGGGDGDGGGGGGRGTWIGLAISPDGKMDGSRAIIGTLTVGSATTANDDDDGGDIREGGVDVVIADGDGADVAGSTVGSVMKYELGTSEWRGFASRMDENRQTLIDASIFIEEYDYRTDEQQRPDDDVGDDKITIVIGGDDNDIDEDDIVMTNAKGRRIVMTFGKLLIEDDGWDVYDLPIYERGNNHFLFARGRYGGNGDGGANELGYHAVRATFVKDFDDDITDSPTPSPTELVERYFCIWDEDKPLRDDEYCDEIRHPIWFDAPDECDCDDDDKSNGPFCLSVSCTTDPPTMTPTVSVEPTMIPTTSPMPTFVPTVEPTTYMPTAIEPTTSTPTDKPVRPSEGFTFNVPTDAGDVITKSIPLSPFVVDFSLAEAEGRLRRSRSLRGEDDSTSASSSTVARDIELLSIVSNHLLSRFGVGLGVEPVGVELIVLKKSEKDDTTVSYSYAGYAVYRSDGRIPRTAILDSEVLKAFNKPPGKAACMDALHSSNDADISGMTNVVATLRDASSVVSEVGVGLDSSPYAAQDDEGSVSAAVAVESPIKEGGDGGGGGGVSSKAGMFAVALLATAFVVAGFIAVRKYRWYRINNANNDYVGHQSSKHGKRTGGAAGSPTTKISVDGGVLKIKRYFNFESPKDGRSLAGPDEEGGNDHMLYDDIEIVGGDTFPLSQDLTIDGNPTTAPLGKHFDRQGKQFDPSDVDTSQPYDEDESTTIEKGSPIGNTTRDMIYFSHIANQMTDDQLEESHATVDDLYSDKDSYFLFGGGGPDKDSIQSLRSVDTLDNTLGLANESISHLIDGIEEILEKREKEENAASLPSGIGSKNIDSLDVVPSHMPMVDTSISMSQSTTDQSRNHIGDVLVDEKVEYDELPVLGATPRGHDEFLKTRLNRIMYERGHRPDMMSSSDRSCDTTKGEAFEFLKDTPTFDSSDVAYESTVNTSDTSTTDELFARIAELESKILNTESQLAREESIKLSSLMSDKEDSNSRTPLITNAKSLRIETSRNETALASSAMQLIFSDATLAMMEQRRLECTPPPSEGDVDSSIIREAKDNALLGKYLDDTDSEEESTIFLLPDESEEK